ncbi:outer membrane protein [Thioflavicoccus mobilis 8321]|uniref:Outer membrane protein n=1 Tax=Thioflavicoccus mobilis 8321 TaxID=765912 RepID=L0GY28_9GAMM|nr:OmpH family outer membrane protein [Thioflavicoccus mobilis]AGA90727.1 outer membrane protein [Thioflavicoccus mobilis 8321]
MIYRAALLALGLAVTVPGFAAQSTAVGYVDMGKVLEQSRLGQNAQERLEKEFGPQRTEIAQEELAIRQLKEGLDRDKPLMSEQQITKRQQEIKDKLQALQKKAAVFQEKLMNEQQKITQEIIGPALKAVEKVASKRKVSAVFERTRAGLLYIEDGLNLTDAVLKQLDADTK